IQKEQKPSDDHQQSAKRSDRTEEFDGHTPKIGERQEVNTDRKQKSANNQTACRILFISRFKFQKKSENQEYDCIVHLISDAGFKSGQFFGRKELFEQMCAKCT